MNDDVVFLVNGNILPLALKYYENPQCTTISEFENDFNRFKYVKKLFNRSDGDVRLILNHIVVLYNVFDRTACTKMLFSYLNSDMWSKLKTILTYLNVMPEKIAELSIISSNIPLDSRIVDELRKI